MFGSYYNFKNKKPQNEQGAATHLTR